jgi:sulfopyruvate decarboxylase alpha subunit
MSCDENNTRMGVKADSSKSVKLFERTSMTRPNPEHSRSDDAGNSAVVAPDVRNWPNLIFQKLREFGIRHVTYVPDSGHARLIELCQAAADMEPTVLTTEEEGIGILAGAWLGGERGVLLMQSSGVGNCINTLSLAKVCGFPLLMIVTMRGEWGEANPWQVPMGQIAASSLRLAGVIVYEVTDADAAAPTVEAAARIAFKGGQIVAVLLSQRMLGAKLFQEGR